MVLGPVEITVTSVGFSPHQEKERSRLSTIGDAIEDAPKGKDDMNGGQPKVDVNAPGWQSSLQDVYKAQNSHRPAANSLVNSKYVGFASNHFQPGWVTHLRFGFVEPCRAAVSQVCL
jgi:hypothetical protein